MKKRKQTTAQNNGHRVSATLVEARPPRREPVKADDEPSAPARTVQAVLVTPPREDRPHAPSSTAAVPQGRRERLAETRRVLFGVFFRWEAGPSIAERREEAYRLLDTLTDPREHERASRLLTHLLAVAQSAPPERT